MHDVMNTFLYTVQYVAIITTVIKGGRRCGKFRFDVFDQRMVPAKKAMKDVYILAMGILVKNS